MVWGLGSGVSDFEFRVDSSEFGRQRAVLVPWFCSALQCTACIDGAEPGKISRRCPFHKHSVFHATIVKRSLVKGDIDWVWGGIQRGEAPTTVD